MEEGYTVLPAFYDFLGKHPDYRAYAEAVIELYNELGAKESGLFLDLACGTGRFISALMDRGEDVIGVDLSPERLNAARKNCARRGHAPLLLCQDMRELDLYGTVDVCTCFSNSLNYLESEEELARVFSLVHNFLTPGGLFLFDVDSLYKFEKLYGDNSYIFEAPKCYCVWQNSYKKRKKECIFYIDIFEGTPETAYKRRSEVQKQRYFSQKALERSLKEAGFELIFRGRDPKGTPVKEDTADVFYLARCIKSETGGQK